MLKKTKQQYRLKKSVNKKQNKTKGLKSGQRRHSQ
jgi:ribosome assembly protein YihI (activator of Der GTPase)